MAEDWRGDLGPLANSVTNLFTSHEERSSQQILCRVY
jgi:hypothetical protein